MNKDNSTQTRRGVLQTGLMILAGGVVVTTAARAQDAEKVAQETVQYQKQPKDGAKCSGCVNWVAPNACKVVSGTIDPNGWCVAYAPKEG